MNRFASFLNGFIVGALVGAAFALLMAPKSGDQLRAEIKHEVDDILDEGRRASEARREELEQQLSQLRDDKH